MLETQGVVSCGEILWKSVILSVSAPTRWWVKKWSEQAAPIQRRGRLWGTAHSAAISARKVLCKCGFCSDKCELCNDYMSWKPWNISLGQGHIARRGHLQSFGDGQRYQRSNMPCLPVMQGGYSPPKAIPTKGWTCSLAWPRRKYHSPRTKNKIQPFLKTISVPAFWFFKRWQSNRFNLTLSCPMTWFSYLRRNTTY